MADRLERSDDVIYAEPDVARRAFAFPNDTFRDVLWGCDNTGQSILGVPGTADADIDADEAWDLTTGDAVGERRDPRLRRGAHPSRPRAEHLRQPGRGGALATNGVDDDANGCVDDWRGWDWVSRRQRPDGRELARHARGRHGRRRGNDGSGVTGVAWHVGLVPLRVLNANGSGQVSDLISAYGYARTQGLKIVNASLGGGAFSQAERDAIAAASDTLFVVAAGNGGSDGVGDDNDSVPTYPCAYDLPNVICVAATDQHDALASFSNYGAASVDLAAPGVNIGSSVPGPDWVYASGTSMATPHVSGAAALVWSRFPSATRGRRPRRAAPERGPEARPDRKDRDRRPAERLPRARRHPGDSPGHAARDGWRRRRGHHAARARTRDRGRGRRAGTDTPALDRRGAPRPAAAEARRAHPHALLRACRFSHELVLGGVAQGRRTRPRPAPPRGRGHGAAEARRACPAPAAPARSPRLELRTRAVDSSGHARKARRSVRLFRR